LWEARERFERWRRGFQAGWRNSRSGRLALVRKAK